MLTGYMPYELKGYNHIQFTMLMNGTLGPRMMIHRGKSNEHKQLHARVIIGWEVTYWCQLENVWRQSQHSSHANYFYKVDPELTFINGVISYDMIYSNPFKWPQMA